MNDASVRAMLAEEAEELAHIGTWVTNGLEDDARVAPSHECCRIFGIAPGSTLTHAGFLSRIHPEDLALVKNLRAQALVTKCACDGEFRFNRVDDGRTRWLHVRCRIATKGGVPSGTMGVVRDVTEERRIVDELRTSELRYRRIVETTNEGIWIIDVDDKTTFVNRRMAAMLGVPLHDMVGRSPYEFMDPADAERARRFVAQHRKSTGGEFEMRLRRPDGSAVGVLIESTPIFDDNGRYEGALAMASDVTERQRAEARFARLAEAGIIGIATGTLDGRMLDANEAYARMLGYTTNELREVRWQDLVPTEMRNVAASAVEMLARTGKAPPFEMDLLRKDGSRIAVLAGAAMLEPTVVLSFIADVTERKAALEALKRSEEQLREAHKMEAIGRLAGGVAHDFNNLLSVILSYASLILGTLNDADPMREDLEEVRSAGERAATLTRQLLAFSRRQVLHPRAIDLNETIGALHGMLSRLVGEDVQLALSLAPDLGRVHADPNQVEQVVMNLVVNARDAMPHGGTLTIETSNAGSFAKLRIADTGTGMDTATLARIFEPFFTTKEKDKGTGLGLSMVHGIVDQSGGRIEVKTEVGKGSVFDVFLPRTERPSVRAKPITATPNSTGTETILLVEDEDRVRALASTILRRHGYEVLEAQNGGEAILLYEERKDDIALLLTDVVMPRINGPRLAKRIRELKADLKVLYMSGYSEELLAPHGAHVDGIPLLSKPIRPEILLAKVRETLDA